MLALAYAVERAIEDGRCPNYAAAAKVLRMSQPHVAHVVNLLSLSASIQEALLSTQALHSEH